MQKITLQFLINDMLELAIWGTWDRKLISDMQGISDMEDRIDYFKANTAVRIVLVLGGFYRIDFLISAEY